MKDKAFTVEFRPPPTKTPTPKPPPGARAERQRQDQAARKARNLALAYWIDGLVRSGQVESLAAVARMCGVSRARVSRMITLLGVAEMAQERTLGLADSSHQSSHMTASLGNCMHDNRFRTDSCDAAP